MPLLKLDEEKIKQVIINLIDNGTRYTKQGSIITLELLKNKVKFCVADSGMGITPEDMVNMFKKFSRGSGHPFSLYRRRGARSLRGPYDG